MSRIQQVFRTLQSQQKKALIPFVSAGDPNPQLTVPLMHAMVAAGANLIELGVPFSDPMADGPVIQKASERALQHHISLQDVLQMVADFRHEDTNTPVVLMGYLNPVEVMGYEIFANQAAAAGVDGVLLVDFPPEESHECVQLLRQRQIDSIYLLSPTTSEQRVRLICGQASGFVYYVSLKGVTGSAALDIETVQQRVHMIKNNTDLPVGVGFGIKDAGTAKRIGSVADAVIVGSALVKMIEQAVAALPHGEVDTTMLNPDIIKKITTLLADMRGALDQ